MVVQPSFLEGFSISLVEAMSHGKCVLASDIPENIEVVEDCAVTFKTQDVTDLQAKMQELLDDPIQVDRVARRGHDLAQERFSWPRIVEATEAVYLDALSDTKDRQKSCERRQIIT